MIPGIIAGAWRERDIYWSNVILAMHMDGADSGTSFPDLKGKTVSAFGNAQTKTATKKYGTASAYFDGSGDYLTVPDSADLDFGTGDLTIEFWFNPSTVDSAYHLLINRQDATTTNMALQIRISSSNFLEAVVRSAGSGTAYTFSGSTTLSTGTWYHAALSRASGVFRLFLDGVQQATLTQSITLDGSAALHVARQYDGGAQYAGYIDDLRITKGVARYTSGFSVPTKEFPSG